MEVQEEKPALPPASSFVDHAHAAVAEFLDDAVLEESFADHGRILLRHLVR